MNELRLEIVIDLCTEATNGDLDDVGVAVEIHVPHLGGDQRARQHFALAAQQQFEQGELLGGEVDALPGQPAPLQAPSQSGLAALADAIVPAGEAGRPLVLAQAAHSAHHGAAGRDAATPAAGELAEGTVRKIDRAAGRITIAHGPIVALEMPPMTMMFRATDPAMLDQVKVGDRIRFAAAEKDGALVVTALEVAR